MVDGISFFIRKDTRELALSLPCKDTARMKPSSSQKESSHQKSKTAEFSDLRLSSVLSFEKLNFYCVSNPTYNIL